MAAIATNCTGIPTQGRDGSLAPAAAPWADMLYGADAAWWRVHAAEALRFHGLKVTASSNTFADVLQLVVTGTDGFDPTPGCIRTGMNSAYQAVHIAAQAGAARILLCGVDMHARAGSHHHGDHEKPLRNTTEATFVRMRAKWTGLLAPLRERGIEIFNCSPGSALTCFPQARVEEMV